MVQILKGAEIRVESEGTELETQLHGKEYVMVLLRGTAKLALQGQAGGHVSGSQPER